MDDLPRLGVATIDLCDAQHHRPRLFMASHECLAVLDRDGIREVAARSPRDDVNLDMSARLAFAEESGSSFQTLPNLLPASCVPSASAEDADILGVGPALLDPR